MTPATTVHTYIELYIISNLRQLFFCFVVYIYVIVRVDMFYVVCMLHLRLSHYVIYDIVIIVNHIGSAQFSMMCIRVCCVLCSSAGACDSATLI